MEIKSIDSDLEAIHSSVSSLVFSLSMLFMTVMTLVQLVFEFFFQRSTKTEASIRKLSTVGREAVFLTYILCALKYLYKI